MTIVENLDLKPYNSYRLPASCKRAYFFDTEEEICSYFRDASKDYILLGSGHNVILSKVFYEEDVIIFNGNFDRVDVKGNIIECEAGVTTSVLCELAQQNNLTGVEMFYDIPSSVGGAVVMNAGAGGESIKDVLIKVRYFDLDDKLIKEIDKEAIGFEYRNSIFQKSSGKIVLKVWFELTKGDPILIMDKMVNIKKARWAKQPREWPNAGSVFKRPEGYFVGAMIDVLGLKGFTIGGAKISEKHGGFIVNFDNATGQDVIEIINFVQARVLDKFGVNLDIEQRIV